MQHALINAWSCLRQEKKLGGHKVQAKQWDSNFWGKMREIHMNIPLREPFHFNSHSLPVRHYTSAVSRNEIGCYSMSEMHILTV